MAANSNPSCKLYKAGLYKKRNLGASAMPSLHAAWKRRMTAEWWKWQYSRTGFTAKRLASSVKRLSLCVSVCVYVCECLEEVLSEHIKQYLSLHENQSTASKCHTCTCRRDGFCKGKDSLSEGRYTSICPRCDSIHGKTENALNISVVPERMSKRPAEFLW